MPRVLQEISDHRPGLQPPQFTLRMLLAAVAIAGVLISVSTWMAPVGICLACITILSIVAHMASTAIGGQLRANGAHRDCEDTTPDDEDLAPREPRLLQPMQAETSDFAPATRLSHHEPLARKPVFVGIGIGAGLGAIAAATALTIAMWESVTIVNVLFGTVCAAGIGGLIGFWASSLFQVASRAFAQAHQDAESS